MAFLVLFAVMMALGRRLLVRPWYIDYRSTDAFRILGLISSVMITFFLAMGAGIRGGHADVASIELRLSRRL